MIIIPLFDKRPSRRNILVGGMIAVVGALLPPFVVARSRPKAYEVISESLAKRQAGVAPNYHHVHTCFQCNREYLCQDRYLTTRCEAAAHRVAIGWSAEPAGACGTCVGFDDLNAAAWWEAHGMESTFHLNA